MLVLKGFKLTATCLAITGVMWAPAARADQTNTQLVTHVLYNGDADYAFFIGQGQWVATGCTAYYAQIPQSQPGKDKLLSIVMTAYAMGKRVSFQGTCSSPGYFSVMYVTVSD